MNPLPFRFHWIAAALTLMLGMGLAASRTHASDSVNAGLEVGTLQPFNARYAVYLDGNLRGESHIRLERVDTNLWRYSVSVEGTRGMAKLAGFESDDVNEFRIENGQLRMLSIDSRNHALLKNRGTRADFDWNAGLARWSGDLKDDRRAPTELTDRAVSSTLLNLMLAIDAARAEDGQAFHYQMLDRGLGKDVEYRAGASEEVSVPAGRYSARPMRRDRRDKNRVVTAWYSSDLPPTPVRLLQTDKGKPHYELRLLAID